MADVVHYRLERTLPELEDLEKRSIFTRSEIAQIVQKRRKFEYRLKRRSPFKQDFLDYIEYEKQLDRLRRLRKKAVSDGDGNGNAGKRRNKVSASDVAGVRRVIEIYRMATKRFKGDIELWFQYLEFCKLRKNGRMKKALAEVMRFHPKVPAVWIYAAAWAYDHNLNFESALSLMQTGLRACPNSEDLWVECVRLILTHLNKLRTRKVMLGEEDNNNKTLVGDNKQIEEKKWHEENEELFMSLADENDGSGDAQVKDDYNKWNSLCLAVLQETYREAVKKLPSSFSLRKRFLEIVEATDLGHLEEVRSEILNDMKRDFSGGADYWNWLARLKLTAAPDISSEEGRLQVDNAIKVYEEATNILPSAVMFEKYVEFLIDTINPNGEEMQNASVPDHIAGYISQLVCVFSKAEAIGCLNNDLACQYIKFYLHMGKADEALKLAEKFCDGNFSDAKEVWVLRVTEQMRCIKESGDISKTALQSVLSVFQKMVKNVAVSDVGNLWLMALDLFANNRKYFGKFLEFSIVVLLKEGGTDYGFSLPATLVKFVHQKDGISKARDLYRRLISGLPRPGLELYKHCIEMENSDGDEASITNARKLFESALATYSQDIILWQDYYSMELQNGTSETANGIYWRAKKTLGDASALSAVSTNN